ncbi:hypothetical protein CK20_004983 [Escherichia coli]|nr:hypothetical protein [Escherichia coli]
MNTVDIKDTLAGVSTYAWMFSVVSIILVFIGWFVTYNNSLKIATRSESKSIIDAIAKILNEISDLSLDYWVNKSTPPDSNPFKKKNFKNSNGLHTQSAKIYLTAIHGKAIQINKYINLLDERGIKITISYFSNIIDEATMECEKSYCFNKSYRFFRAQNVSSACVDFIMHLYDSFQKNHPPRKPVYVLKTLKQLDCYLDKWHNELCGRQ